MPGKQAKPRLTRKEKKAQNAGLVETAMASVNPLSDMKDWSSYKKHGLNLKIEYRSSKDIDADDMKHIFDLTKQNMQEIYEESGWGWKDEVKLAELSGASARFLLVKNPDGELVGFTHFRFEVEVNCPLLYCYELQISSEIQRKGVGEQIVHLLTLLAHKFKLLKIVLTVLKENVAGMNFYMSKLKFRRDETCPYDEEEKCYLILCKPVGQSEVLLAKSFIH